MDAARQRRFVDLRGSWRGADARTDDRGSPGASEALALALSTGLWSRASATANVEIRLAPAELDEPTARFGRTPMMAAIARRASSFRLTAASTNMRQAQVSSGSPEQAHRRHACLRYAICMECQGSARPRNGFGPNRRHMRVSARSGRRVGGPPSGAVTLGSRG